MYSILNTNHFHPLSDTGSLYEFIEIIALLMTEFPNSDSVELVDNAFILKYKNYTFKIARIDGIDHTLNKPSTRLVFESIHNDRTVASFITGRPSSVAAYLSAEKNAIGEYKKYHMSSVFNEWDRNI